MAMALLRGLMIIGFLARHSAKPLKVDDATRNVCGRDYTLFVAITATTNVSKAHCETLAIELLGRNPCVVIAHSNTAFVQDIVKAKSNPQGWAGAAAIVVVEPEAGVLAGMLQSIDLSHLCTSDATNSSAELEDDESSWMVSERKLAGKVKNTHQKKSIEKKRKHDSHSTSKAVSAGGLVDTSARLTRLKFVVIDREPLFEVLASSTAAQSRVLHATVFGMELRRKIEYAHYAFGKVFDVFNTSIAHQRAFRLCMNEHVIPCRGAVAPLSRLKYRKYPSQIPAIFRLKWKKSSVSLSVMRFVCRSRSIA